MHASVLPLTVSEMMSGPACNTASHGYDFAGSLPLSDCELSVLPFVPCSRALLIPLDCLCFLECRRPVKQSTKEMGWPVIFRFDELKTCAYDGYSSISLSFIHIIRSVYIGYDFICLLDIAPNAHVDTLITTHFRRSTSIRGVKSSDPPSRSCEQRNMTEPLPLLTVDLVAKAEFV
jgi:hypothetical protein